MRQYLPNTPEMDIWLRRAALHAISFLPEADRQKYAVENPTEPEDLMAICLLNYCGRRTGLRGSRRGKIRF